MCQAKIHATTIGAVTTDALQHLFLESGDQRGQW